MANSANTTEVIENDFGVVDMENLPHAVSSFLDCIPENNLTQWHKEQGILTNQAKARLLSALCGALDYQIKNLRANIAQKISELSEHLQSNGQGTEIHEVKTESKIEYIKSSEVTLDSMESVFDLFKVHYESTAQEKWQPYVAKPTVDTNTAGKLMAEELIAKYQK